MNKNPNYQLLFRRHGINHASSSLLRSECAPSGRKIVISGFLIILSSLLTLVPVRATPADDYKAGVEAYLNGETRIAYEKLKSVLDAEPEHERARQLFQKVLSEKKSLPSHPQQAVQKTAPLPALPQAKNNLPGNTQPDVSASSSRPDPTEKSVVFSGKSRLRETVSKRISPPENFEKNSAREKQKSSPEGRPERLEEEPRSADIRFAIKAVHLYALVGLFLASGFFFLLWFSLMQTRHLREAEGKTLALKTALQRRDENIKTLENRLAVEKEAGILAEKKFHEWQRQFQSARPQQGSFKPPALSSKWNPAAPPPILPESPGAKIKGNEKTAPIIVTPQAAAPPQSTEALADIPNVKKRHLLERLAREMGEIHRLNPKEALDIFNLLTKDSRPLTRAATAGALGSIGSPECVSLLFNLYHDQEAVVQREALKELKALQKRKSLQEDLRVKIESLLEEEMNRGEWVF